MSEVVNHPHEGTTDPYVCVVFDHDPTLAEVHRAGDHFALLLCDLCGIPRGSFVVPDVRLFDDSNPRTLCMKLPLELASLVVPLQALLDLACGD
jgi:hypothetical protein